MPEVIVKYTSPEALAALQKLAKEFDMDISLPVENSFVASKITTKQLPITYAKHPDFMALAGIWKDRDITSEELRKAAWGDRF